MAVAAQLGGLLGSAIGRLADTPPPSRLGFTRKIYMVFDLSDRPTGVQSETLVLAVERHIEGRTPETSGPLPFNVYGISDDNELTDQTDWELATIPEDAIDNPGTRYAFDLTDYINDRIANDKVLQVTILIAHKNQTYDNVNTSSFFSKKQTGDERNSPFLRLE
ncbi:MAG: hypothetical protein WCE62_00430 [Polyangiales bacterium]